MWLPVSGPELVWLDRSQPGHHIGITRHWLTNPTREQYLTECTCGWTQWNIALNPAVLYAARHQRNAVR
ncbi:hypothetical protein [Nocardia altamirensis]|uniref:hypothetical protein n=1 Tax=Nocardia altamirensis TaxID=472158 RepID=UPI00083FDCB6|nr:hypothetical protein [Nocardia altamirensis]